MIDTPSAKSETKCLFPKQKVQFPDDSTHDHDGFVYIVSPSVNTFFKTGRFGLITARIYQTKKDRQP